MLSHVLKKINGNSSKAEITALEDLGFANNFTRMQGGFYTGINVKWDSDIPFIPIDTTVNSCGVSVFKYDDHMDYSEFKERLTKIDTLLKSHGITNNFNRGNHFISVCEDVDGNQYLILHASDKKYKFGKAGLYPREDTWFFDKIQISYFSKGYIRYLIGETAERFYNLYLEAEKSNPKRNRIVAELILDGYTGFEELVYSPHYGMPNDTSVCIGSQWQRTGMRVMLTREGAPIYLITEEKPFCQFMPHGFGLAVKGDFHKLAFSNKQIVINDLTFNCDDGFINTGIATTRNSDTIINRETIKQFMPLRSITFQKELIQKFSYTRNGIISFE